MSDCKVGQEIKTIKYTDNKDIEKVRVISKIRYASKHVWRVKFEGLQGWWIYRELRHGGGKVFTNSHNGHLEIVE